MCLSNLTRIIQNFACAMIFAIMPFTIISAQTPALPSKEVPAMQSVPKKPVTTQVADAPQAATPTKKEVIQGYLAFIATLDPTLTIEQRVAAINGYTEKTYKTKGDLTVEGLLAQGYNAYYTETNDAAPLLNTLQASGKISVSLQKYLLALNTKLLAAKTEADILLIMQGALKEIAANKYAFEKESKRVC